MARFTQYPTASTGDYADATTFLIANEGGEVKQASLEGLRDTFGSSLQSASLVIPSAQVLALNTTPQTIVEAQGTGKAIEVISASVKLSFNTTAYSVANTVLLEASGANQRQAEAIIFDSTVSTVRSFIIHQAASATDTQIIANAALQVKAKSADPTLGDSDVEVFVLYRVIDI